MTGVTSRLYVRLAILAVGLFIVGTNGFMIAGLLPDIAKTLDVHTSDVGYTITFYSIVVAVAAPAMSILFPRMPRTTLMVGGLLLIAVGTFLAAAAPTLLIFTIGRVLAGFGGAALVPTATAAAASLASPERRGRAIAFVGVGFTAATAFGAPLGTAVAAAGSWRIPLVALATLSVIIAIAAAVFVRQVPIGAPVSIGRRFAVLGNPGIALALLTTTFVVSAFNMVYIFSSAITGTSGTVLAALLLAFGVAGILGNVVSGRLVDRFGGRVVGVVFLGAQALIFAFIPLAAAQFVTTIVVFAIWGIASNGGLLPIQHRLVEIDPALSGVALSWFSTALYAGIALAPPLGALAMHLGDAALVPLVAAGLTVIGAGLFLAGYLVRRRSAIA